MANSISKQTRESLERCINQHRHATLRQIADFLGVSRQRAHIRKQSIMQPMTDHEVEILGYIQKGYNNRQIAEAVKQSDRTVKNQLNLIFAKLNAKNRNHAVALAIEKRLISLDKLD